MASRAYLAELEVNPLPCVAPEAKSREVRADRKAALAAVSIEFVANGRGTAQGGAEIAEAVEEVLGGVPGFAGSLVMFAEQEKRLVTAITFWSGPERMALSRNSAPWVHKAIAGYVEHCLRVGCFETNAGGLNFAGQK